MSRRKILGHNPENGPYEYSFPRFVSVNDVIVKGFVDKNGSVSLRFNIYKQNIKKDLQEAIRAKQDLKRKLIEARVDARNELTRSAEYKRLTAFVEMMRILESN